MRELVIENPKLQTLRQKYTSFTLTSFFWFIWFYIWTPLITLVFWFFGFDFFYSEIFTYESYQVFILDIQKYFISIFFLCTALGSWALYNFYHFRNSKRYKEPLPVSLEELSDYIKIEKEALKKYQSTKILTVEFDEKDYLVAIREYND
jgi:biofilm PGA synthesis protein PgaD